MCGCTSKKIGKMARKKKSSYQGAAVNAGMVAVGAAASKVVGSVSPLPTTVTNIGKGVLGLAIATMSKDNKLKAIGVGMTGEVILGYITPLTNRAAATLIGPTTLRGIPGSAGFKQSTGSSVGDYV